jgi:CRISPR-associated endonuclease/helicase Cas3
VVDRRVVVDQATAEAESLVKRIGEAAECSPLRNALQALSLTGGSSGALAVSTLRGERADNRAWSVDPSRPAIIVGTVDMVGSRLLFSGYGDSRRRRTIHAGLLGQDTLIVNDEAHLTVAFADLLTRLREFTGGQHKLRTMLLSATPRDNKRPSFPADFDANLTNDQFRKRYRAVKRLHLSEHDDAKKEIQRLANEPDRRTIVFVRFPEDAQKIAATIENKHKGTHVPLLTGMQRGWERDQLLEDCVVKRFRAKDAPAAGAEPCWLVATSAGEVGIDLTSDRVVTDLDTADHLLQRFGRLNRFGETEGDAYVVFSPKQISGDKGDAPRLKATLDYLRTLPDASPETLRKLPPSGEALSAEPHFAPLLPWHIDVWSMTSISAKDWPSRPLVEYWLRGDDEKGAPPETYIAWRDDVRDLAKPGVPGSDREDVFDCYPVLAQERLAWHTGRLCDALEKSAYPSEPAILIGADGEIYAGTLRELLEDQRFEYATLVLPPGVGHLDENGMVDWSKSTAGAETNHYDRSATKTRQHWRVAPGEATRATGLRWRYTVRIPAENEDEEGPQWMYFAGDRVGKKPKQGEELLAVHREQVAKVAADLARRVGLGERMVQVFEWAGRWHDAGKARDIWQRAAGSTGGTEALAKSKNLNGRMLGGYRHEMGSVLDAECQLPSDFTEAERDLALYLVSAHHGWARPHFPEQAYDKNAYLRSERAALECARRFGRLQRRYGAWRLAYLDAVFRSADAIASGGA